MIDFRKKELRVCISLFILLVAAMTGVDAIADVGNQNRYTEDGSNISGDDGMIDFLLGALLTLIAEHPGLGVPTIVIIFIVVLIYLRQRRKQSIADAPRLVTPPEPTPQQQHAVAEQIQAIDPMFSADKFTAWAREVFIKLQQAWTERNWRPIRPFESEELFQLHNTQLEEYLRNNKINVVEKIGIKSCQLASFMVDGDKEVLTVRLSAVMRDYVVDATTRQVLESSPDKDWYMTYLMTFNRKKGVQTQVGLSNRSTTNCPNCGAPTEITSAGQCEYCGSIITTGEHDWVLTDIHSI